MNKQDDLLTKAIQNLKIDVPIMASRLVGDRIELWLYGGHQVTYPEIPSPSGEG